MSCKALITLQGTAVALLCRSRVPLLCLCRLAPVHLKSCSREAFTARQRSPVAPENPDDSEEVQKQMAEEWQWHFLLQLTYYSYETCPSVQEEAAS